MDCEQKYASDESKCIHFISPHQGFLRTITDDLALLEMEHQNRFTKSKNEIDFNNCARKIYSLNYFGVKRFLN